MTSEELLQKIKKIEIKAKGLNNQLFQGSYKSAFKGSGMTFAEVREYNLGDETRTIDWNVTARFNEPFVKTFEEERELTVMLLVDVSASGLIATQHSSKQDYIAEIAAVLAFSAIGQNDKVGVLFFSDTIEKYIPPKKGKSHVLRIIKDLVSHQSVSKGTNIANALKYFNSAQSKKCTVFLLSDFLDDKNFKKELQITALKHDFVALNIVAKNEGLLLDVGWTYLQDAESGELVLVNTSKEEVRLKYQKYFRDFYQKLSVETKKLGVDVLNLEVGEAYYTKLLTLFANRR